MAELGVEIAGIVALIAALWVFRGGVYAHIDDSLERLSEELAQVVLSVAQSAASANIDQPNPMQMMLMQIIQQRMASIDLPRSPTGQFEALPTEKGSK